MGGARDPQALRGDEGMGGCFGVVFRILGTGKDDTPVAFDIGFAGCGSPERGHSTRTVDARGQCH